MKRSSSILVFTILILAMVFLFVGCLGFIPHSVFNIAVVTTAILDKSSAIVTATFIPTPPEAHMTPTPAFTLPPGDSALTLTPTLPEDYLTPTAVSTPFPTPTVDPQLETYGQVYFTLEGLNAVRLVRLPGACLLGLHVCAGPETVLTPFDMKDVFDPTHTGLSWSRDGRYAALTIRPQDALQEGQTSEELEQLKRQNPVGFAVNRSTLFIFDTQWNNWGEIYHAEQKYIYPGVWSPDGQWLSFALYSSEGGSQPLQSEDGIYIIHPNGGSLRQLANMNEGSILGWIGSSVVVQRTLTSSPIWRYRLEMLGLDGQVKTLFESSRIAFYHLSPDGGSLLATDASIMDAPISQKAVDLLALDGSTLHSFGMFNNRTSSISAGTWSSDGSQIAFANLRRAYVAPRDGRPREVYAADDRFVEAPEITQMQFSPDNRYLLMQVNDGRAKLVSVSLEDGQARTLELPDKNDMLQPGQFSWQP